MSSKLNKDGIQMKSQKLSACIELASVPVKQVLSDEKAKRT